MANWIQGAFLTVVIGGMVAGTWHSLRRQHAENEADVQRQVADGLRRIGDYLEMRAVFEAWDRDRQDGQ